MYFHSSYIIHVLLSVGSALCMFEDYLAYCQGVTMRSILLHTLLLGVFDVH